MTKPYGYVRADGQGVFIYGEHQFQNIQDVELIPVYTEQPQRTWVGLTHEDKVRILANDFGGNRLDCMDAAERILKEKNNGN